MKRYIWGTAITAIFLVFPFWVAAVDYLAEADKVFDQGGLENYKKSIDLYLKAVEQQPDDYEANWKSARAYREYADKAKKERGRRLERYLCPIRQGRNAIRPEGD
jgi:hypothetical protein